MKKLRIAGARARDFGRLGNNNVTLSASDFVVVTGPNEIGKSTLADLLSWVLAGRRGNNGTRSRFVDFRNRDAGATSVQIGGQIDGFIGEQHFSVSREFIIRSTNQGREPASPLPNIFLDGVEIPSGDWGPLIGVLDGDQFYNQYRITGPYDPANQVDVMVLLEALTVGTTVSVPPRDVINCLEEAADRLVHDASGRNAGHRLFKILSDRHEEARDRRRQIEDDFSSSTELEGQIRTSQEDQVRLETELRQLREEREAIKTASELIAVAVDGKAAAEELAKLPIIDPDLQQAHAVAADVEATISRLETAIGSETSVAQSLTDAVRLVGIDLEDASGVVVPDGTLDAVTGLVSDRRTAAQEIDLAIVAEDESQVRLGMLNGNLGLLAEELHTSSEHLLSLGVLTLDDFSFGDPLRNWVDADRALPNIESTARTASDHEKSCRLEFDRVDRMWSGAGLATAPQLVAAGQGHGAGESRPQRLLGLALVVFMTAAASFVHRAAGVAAALVGLGILWGLSRRPGQRLGGPVGKGITKEEMSLAEEWVQARGALEAAEAATRAADLALSIHQGQLSGFRAAARSALEGHGFGETVDSDLAAKIRAERSTIRDLVRQIDEESRSGATAENRRVRNHQAIERVNAALSGMAVEAGLGRFGDTLTVEKVQDAREVQRLFSELNKARREVSDLWNELQQLAGHWSVGLSIGEVKRIMAETAEAVIARETLEGTRRRSETEIDSRAPRGSRAAQLLDDPTMTPDVLQVHLENIDRDASDKEKERDAELTRVGSLSTELRGLANQDDLPLVQQELEQVEIELSDVSVRGAALLLAARIVLDVKDEVERANQPAVIRRASDLAIAITGGQWTGLAIAEDRQIAAGQNGLWMDQVSLSAGARDVLRLCIRIAFAEHHAEKTGVALPLILDDPTASVDASRAPRLFEVLAEFSTRHQVILMTHDPVTVEHALSVGAVVVNLQVQN